MSKRRDQHMLESAYSNIGAFNLSAPSMMGKPVIVTMDMPGAEVEMGNEEECCGCGEEDIHTLIDILDRLPSMLETIQSLPISGELSQKLRQAADCVDSCCGEKDNMFTLGSYDTL
jgi:hypothetical protein